MNRPPRGEFERLADEAREEGLLADLWDFLAHHKKWWLLPILAVLLVVGLLAALSAHPVVGPFLYTLF